MTASRNRRYPAYRDSGVEWLGEVPEAWEVRRLRIVADLRAGSAITSESIRENGDYAVYGGNGVRGYCDEYTHEGRYPLIGRQGALCGNVTLANGRFWASEHAVVVRPLREMEVRWLAFLLAAMDLNQYSVSAAQPGLAVGVVGDLALPLPPFPEQRAIAAFLDRETAKIDTLVAKKERLLELLDEKRTAVISRAVTKGLEPNVPMKDSGVEWLGEVPEGWEVVSLGLITKSRCDGPFGSGLKSEHYRDDGVRVVRLQNIRFARFDDGDRAFIDAEYYGSALGDHSVKAGDLLIAGLGDTTNPVGRACVAPSGLGIAMVKADCFRFRLNEERAVPHFLALQLSAAALSAAGVEATGATRGRINLSTTASRRVPLPPLPEQRAIASYLDRETARIDTLKAKVQKAIGLLKEYRTALISAAVTGKIDVRGEVADPAA